ncbi:MAG: hypothetical protein NZT61_03510 [Deltaproteobacteria bacterium]|nr:hypothetical protein [Deltaproteobacteria bacterium]MCX7952602.1 hypothetical protein [Deltaproteobacteria bacterium]
MLIIKRCLNDRSEVVNRLVRILTVSLLFSFPSFCSTSLRSKIYHSTANIPQSSPVIVRRSNVFGFCVNYFITHGANLRIVSPKDLSAKKFLGAVNLNYVCRRAKKPIGIAKGTTVCQSDLIYHEPKGRKALVILKNGRVTVYDWCDFVRNKNEIDQYSGWFLGARIHDSKSWFETLKQENTYTVVNGQTGLAGLDPNARIPRTIFLTTKDGKILAAAFGKKGKGLTLKEALVTLKKLCKQHRLLPDYLLVGDSGSATVFLDRAENTKQSFGTFLAVEKKPNNLKNPLKEVSNTALSGF